METYQKENGDANFFINLNLKNNKIYIMQTKQLNTVSNWKYELILTDLRFFLLFCFYFLKLSLN
jgi:hypothetical protein